VRDDAILSEKLPILTAPFRYVASYTVNPRKNGQGTTKQNVKLN